MLYQHTLKEIQNTHLWWTNQFVGLNFGFMERRTGHLSLARMFSLHNLWELGTSELRLWPDVLYTYSLIDAEQRKIKLIQLCLPPKYMALKPNSLIVTLSGGWIGLFHSDLLDN
jgi:hypothetical protein